MISAKAKLMLEEKRNAFGRAITQYDKHRDPEELFNLWRDITILFSAQIPELSELYEEINQYNGLILRNSKAVISLIDKFILENYYPVERELIDNTTAILTAYPKAYAQYQSAMQKYTGGVFERNILDDMRLSLELLLKNILNNSKSLENNIDETGRFLEDNNVSNEIKNVFRKLLNYYSRYQNNHVKHNDNVPENELELIIELTSVFIKFVVSVKNEGATQNGQA
jgi:hypothetical protein